jgi:hypothetical protein
MRMSTSTFRRLTAHARIVQVILATTFAWILPVAAQSVLSMGPRSVQTLVSQQLFDRAGRWFLIDDGGCYAYLESPHTQLEADRLILHAHLSSRLGQTIGNICAGADFASNVTLSGKLHGGGHLLILDDIRIDRVDDESTRSALNLALQVDPQVMPHAANIDVSDLVRKDVIAAGGSPARLDEFRIVNITTRTDAVVIQFNMRLSAP